MDLDWSALGLSLKVAGWATAINLVLGVGLGALLARRRFPGRELLDSLLTLPMVLPPTVLGYYLLVLIGRNGPIGAWLQSWFGINLIFTWQAAVVAAAVASLPLVFKPARAAFEDVDGQLEQAARTLGVSEAAVFFRITLPLAWRGILAGLLLAFARAMGEFGSVSVVSGKIRGETNTMPLYVEILYNEYNAVAAFSVASLLALLALVTLAAKSLLEWRFGGELAGGARRH
jgi:molybdate transport system permease protein